MTYKLTPKPWSFITVFFLLVTLSHGQNSLTFDGPDYMDNQDLGNPYLIANNGETFIFTSDVGAGYTQRHESSGGFCNELSGVSHLITSGSGSTPAWTIDIQNGNEIDLQSIQFYNQFRCPGSGNFAYSFSIEGFKDNVSTGTAQTFNTGSSSPSSVFTAGSNFDDVDRIVISKLSGSEIGNLGITEIIWESTSAGGSCAPSLEDFEDESLSASSFTDNGQVFNITGSLFDINSASGGGWNGTMANDQFIDNTGETASNDGTNLTIATDNGADFNILELYVFCANTSLQNHSGTITFEGYRDGGGTPVFSFTKNSGFSDVQNFTPSNGFTQIDFATEAGVDYSDDLIDELRITSMGNLEYIALDAFEWCVPTTVSSPEITFTASPTDLGSVLVGSSVTQTYTIENTGSATLTISSITSDNMPLFSVQNALMNISVGASATFEVAFSPTACIATTYMASITINSNDSDEGVLTFQISGASTLPTPEVSVISSPSQILEDEDQITFVFTFTFSEAVCAAITVNFLVSGDATYNEDYYLVRGADTFTTTSGTVTIPAGQTSVEVVLQAQQDAIQEMDETIILTVD